MKNGKGFISRKEWIEKGKDPKKWRSPYQWTEYSKTVTLSPPEKQKPAELKWAPESLSSLFIKWVLTIFTVVIFGALISQNVHASCDAAYAKVGAGYKLEEQKKFIYDRGSDTDHLDLSPYSARFEFGVECKQFTFGVSHQSQWATGWPVNTLAEPHKTEIFIDYTYRWGI